MSAPETKTEYVVVPREPTVEMWAAAARYAVRHMKWKAMLGAADSGMVPVPRELLEKFINTAERVSDILHEIERGGFELKDSQDRRWSALTSTILEVHALLSRGDNKGDKT